MSTMPHRHRSATTRTALAVSAVAAVAALTACGSSGSANTASTTSPATSSPATPSASATATPSASGTATTPPASSSATATKKPSGATGSALPADPWNHPEYKVGFFVPPASVGGQENPIGVKIGKYQHTPGQENWGIDDTGKTERYERVSSGRYYVSCLLSGRKRAADGSDLCPVTMAQLDQYVIDQRSTPPEFWYHLDGKGRIDVAFQVYHP